MTLEKFDSLKVGRYDTERLESELKSLEKEGEELRESVYGPYEPDGFDLMVEHDPEMANIHYEAMKNLLNPLEVRIDEISLEIRRIKLELERRKREEVESEIISDIELSLNETESDLLNYKTFATKLAKVIKEANKGTHVGVMGDWGSGKSFLLNLLENELSELGRSKVIRFNASVGESDTTIWYSLLSRVSETYSSGYNLFKSLCFIFHSIRRKGGLNRLVPFFVSIIFFVLMGLKISGNNLISDFFVYISGFISLTTLGIQITTMREIFFIDRNFFTKFSYPNYNEKLGEQGAIKIELEIFRDLILKSYKVEKLVIIVDELDRCDRDRLERFFGAIETFIDMENVVFVFSINPQILYVEENERKVLDATYLEKYFKISFVLPPNYDYGEFIEKKCGSWTTDTKLTSCLTEMVNKITEYTLVTPRKLNKALNFITIYRNNYEKLTLIELSTLVILLTFYNNKVLAEFEKNKGSIESFRTAISDPKFLGRELPVAVKGTFMHINPDLNFKLVYDTSVELLKLLK